MTVATWLVFAVGAGVGAPLRFLIDGAIDDRTDGVRPNGTLAVNAIGSLLLGVIAGLALRDQVVTHVETIVGVGFTGALTTFSTFALETVRLLEAGEVEAALKLVTLHALIAIGLAAVGYVAALNLA